MADSTFTLFRGAAATSSATLYTSPANMAVAITNIAIVNDSAASVTATINLATFPLIGGMSIPANSTQFIDLDQVIYNTETITGSASTTTVDFHIAGYEVY